MDFHKLVSKLKEIEPSNVFNPQGKTTELKPVERVALSEDAQMRVLAGVSTMLAEGRRISDRETVVEKKLTTAEKKKKEEVVKAIKRDDPEKRTGKGKASAYAIATAQAKKTAESQEVDVDALIEDEETSEFKKKFNAMVEAKKEDKKKMAKKEKQMDEASKPDANKDGIPDYAQDGKGAKDLGKGAAPKKAKKTGGKKEMSAAQKKFFGGKNESVKTLKRVVAESVQSKLSFVECLKIVKESGGQQQIDPVDSALWNWAQRVAATKIGSGIRADAYAARVYESYGGEFQLYDVLSENQK